MATSTKHPVFSLMAIMFSFLLLACGGALLLPSSAAAQDGWDALEFRTTSDDCGPFSIGKYEARDSSVSYCMNQERFGPSTPGGPWLTYDKGWTWLEDEFAAVVCHGYPANTSFGGHALSPDRARAATQLAVWMINGTTSANGSYSYTDYKGVKHSGSFKGDNEVVAAARWLYESAKSGVIKAASHRARRYTGPVAGSQRQDMLYVLPTVEASFEKRSGDTTITQGNDSYSLADAEFDIHESAGDALVAHIKMDGSGHARVTLLPNTSYYLVETKAPRGYLPRTDRIAFTTGTTPQNALIDERPGSISLAIVKTDAATGGVAQPGATLAGGEFKIVSDSTPGWSKTVTTGDDGRVTLTGIPLGTITIFESKAPEGYLPSKETWSYQVGPDQMGDAGTIELEHTVSDIPIAFDLEISKFKDAGTSTDSGLEQPAGDVRFEVIRNSDRHVVGELTTNVYGFASTSGDTTWFGDGSRPVGVSGSIPYDRCGYTVHEVEETVPAGFKHVADWTIPADQLADGAKLQYIVDNHALNTHLQIVKRDAESGRTVPLAGFTFQILDAERNPIDQTVWHPSHEVKNRFTTDKTGTVTLPESLITGTYYLRELEASAPYLTMEDAEFTIPADIDLSPVVILNAFDAKMTGCIEIIKKDAADAKTLAGAEFDIRAADDIENPDGTVWALAGQTVAQIVTDDTGHATADGLSLGKGSVTYEVVETKAPTGYLLDDKPREVTLKTGAADATVARETIEVENDYTKVDISKVDATSSQEVPGAKLTLLDSDGAVIESWESTDTPHRIEHLAPGTYTLHEELAPRTYDMAEDVTFELKAEGNVQKIVMKDEPIEVEGKIDKRQQIATPLDGKLAPNGDGANRASAQQNSDGTYAYTVDFNNASNTWVDEFTVTDDLEAVTAGAAKLDSIETPVADGDYDGLMNVWYKTDARAAGPGEGEMKNATKDDGHGNPWLDDENVVKMLGDDTRGVDYEGWYLWKGDVSTLESETLLVSELDLGKRHVTGIRFEFGRVDAGFTTRPDEDSWNRDDLKDEHDDIDGIARSDDAAGQAAIVHMKATAGYVPAMPLDNSARVDLYRNGGGEGLESHDDDRVTQRCAPIQDLPQTGAAPVAAAMTALLTTAGVILMHSRVKRR